MSASLILLSISIFVYIGNAHNMGSYNDEEPCGVQDASYLRAMKVIDPFFVTTMHEFDARLQQWPFNYSDKPWDDDDILEIPVNFHILYNPDYNRTAPNLSYEQIISQLIILINDYNKKNSDWIKTPDEFIGRVSDYDITYKLSKIILKQTDIVEFNRYDDAPLYYDDRGGSSAIDTDVVLNIHVMDISNGLLGRGQFPWIDSPETDGIIIFNGAFGSRDYDYAGNFYFVYPNKYDKGRTATHEAGHWMALRHIWGDGGCAVDDFVSDTPLQGKSYGGCPSYPQYTCSSSDMFMNYMDYVYDQCMFMFSNGQRNRSYAAFDLFESRKSFLKYKDEEEDCDEFVNAIYFVVNNKDNNISVSCAYRDVPDFGLIDLNEDFDSNYEIIPCVQTTENKYVDPVIDIQVVTDGKCDDVDDNTTDSDHVYFVNTNLNYGRDGFQDLSTNICFIKGEKDTDCDDRIVRIGFFISETQIDGDHEILVEIDDDNCECDKKQLDGSTIIKCEKNKGNDDGSDSNDSNDDGENDSSDDNVSTDDSHSSDDSDSDSDDGEKKKDQDKDECNEWHIVPVNINRDIGAPYLYIGFQRGDACKDNADTQEIDNLCQLKNENVVNNGTDTLDNGHTAAQQITKQETTKQETAKINIVIGVTSGIIAVLLLLILIIGVARYYINSKKKVISYTLQQSSIHTLQHIDDNSVNSTINVNQNNGEQYGVSSIIVKPNDADSMLSTI